MKKSIILYSLSTALNKGAVLLFFPLLISYLTLEEFGTWSLVIVFSNLLLAIISFNGSASIIREGSNNLDLGYVLLLRYSFLTIIISIILVFIVNFFMGDNWLFYSLLISFSEALLFLILTYFRIKDESFKYLLISFLKTIAILLLIIYIKKFHLELDMLFFYHFLIVLILALILLFSIYLENYNNTINYKFSSIFLFGIILIPHSLSQWIMSSSDRLILDYFLGAESVGIYSLAYNMAMILMLLNSGLALSLPTFLIRNYEDWVIKDYDNKFLRYYSIIAVILFIIIMLCYVFDSIYFKILGYYSLELILLITIIYLSLYILGVYYFYVNYLYYYKKASIISKSTFYAAILNIILTILLIQFLDIIGAAIATLISYSYYLYLIRGEVKKIKTDINIFIFWKIFFVLTSIITCSILFSIFIEMI